MHDRYFLRRVKHEFIEYTNNKSQTVQKRKKGNIQIYKKTDGNEK